MGCAFYEEYTYFVTLVPFSFTIWDPVYRFIELKRGALGHVDFRFGYPSRCPTTQGPPKTPHDKTNLSTSTLSAST